MTSIFWISAYYIACFLVSVAAVLMVMWRRIPTGVSGTVGFTLIALVTAGIASDWLDANLPWIGVKRGLILWAGLLFVAYWVLQKPWVTYERRTHRPAHRRGREPIVDVVEHNGLDDMPIWPRSQSFSDEPPPPVEDDEEGARR